MFTRTIQHVLIKSKISSIKGIGLHISPIINPMSNRSNAGRISIPNYPASNLYNFSTRIMNTSTQITFLAKHLHRTSTIGRRLVYTTRSSKLRRRIINQSRNTTRKNRSVIKNRIEYNTFTNVRLNKLCTGLFP